MAAEIGSNKTKDGLLFEINKIEMLVIMLHKIPSHILKLNAIPVYLTDTGNNSAKTEGKMAAWMLNKKIIAMLIMIDIMKLSKKRDLYRKKERKYLDDIFPAVGINSMNISVNMMFIDIILFDSILNGFW